MRHKYFGAGEAQEEEADTGDQPMDTQLERFEQRLGKIAGVMRGELKKRCPEISDRMGKYTLLSLLCSRGPSFVFQAIDEQLNRLVVIKVYRNGRSDEAREMLINEARTMSRVNSRYVSKCIDVSEQDGLPFMVLEHVSGIDLAEFLASHEPSVEMTLELMEQIAEGMRDVHSKGILHLDLKPSNVLLLPNGDIKIIDFGLAQSMVEIKTDNRSGTMAYMAPERAKNDIGLVGPASDVFGLGTVFYSLLTGRAPFEANSKPRILNKALKGEIVSPRSQVSRISKAVDRLCMKCLEQNVFERFQSIESFLDATRRVIAKRERNRFYARFSVAVTTGLAAAILVLCSISLTEPSHDFQTHKIDRSYVVSPSGHVYESQRSGLLVNATPALNMHEESQGFR